MKRIQYIIITFIGLMLTILPFSCEDMLDEVAYSKIINSDIEDSDDGADMWVMGTYNALNRWFVYDEFPRSIELDGDYITGPNWAFGELGSGNFQGATKQGDVVWKLGYELINRANEAIYHVNLMTNTTEEHKNNVLGELNFLKAYTYFMIVKAYGDIPIYYESINQGALLSMPRKPIADVYDHIIELLTLAKDNLYSNTSTAFEEGRVCAGSAAALLAKVYATMGSAALPSGTVYVKGGNPFYFNEDGEKIYTQPQLLTIQKQQVSGYENFDPVDCYTKARDLAKAVMDGEYGDHMLVPYSQLWSSEGRDSREHLFALQSKSGDDNLGVMITRLFCGQATDGVINSGLWYGQRDHWYKLFENKDLRIVDGIQHRFIRLQAHGSSGGAYYPNTEEMRLIARGEDAEENKIADPQPPFDDGRNYTSDNDENHLAFTTKYLDVTDRSLFRTDALYPFLRYADLVLIFAEASNELNPLNSEAFNALNSVRTRSKATAINNGPPESGGVNTQELFRSAVIEERARELAFEADRRWDLIRWGIYLDVMNAIGSVDEVNASKVRTEKHLLYPIPDDEIITNQEITENNPGWL